MAEISRFKIRSTTYTLKDEVARETKIDRKVSTSYAGKYLRVGDDGIIYPASGSTTSISFDKVSGDPYDNANLKTALDGKISYAQGSGKAGKYLSTNSDGNVNFVNLPVATTSQKGIVKPDGTSITINSSGVISSSGSSSIDWSNVGSKPFNSIGASSTSGLKVDSGVLNVNFGNSSGTVCAGTDSRLSDSRTPTSHALTHKVGGTDELALNGSQISTGVVNADRLPKATSTSFGTVKPDGTTITISDGVISSAGGSAVWGAISGDIGNQTDLMDEINTLSSQIGSCVSNAGDRHITLEWKDDGWLYARTESA